MVAKRLDEVTEIFRGRQYFSFCFRELKRKDYEGNEHGNRRHRIVRGRSSEIEVVVLRCLKSDLGLC